MPRSNRNRPTASMLVVAQRDLDDREARAVRRVHAQAVEAVEHARVCAVEVAPELVAALLVDVEAGEHGAERRDGRRAGVEVRAAAATLSRSLTSVGQAMKASSDE